MARQEWEKVWLSEMPVIPAESRVAKVSALSV